MNKLHKSYESWRREKLKNPKFRKAYYDYDLTAKLAAQISTLRKKRGMTQSQLARRAKTVQEVISRLETTARPGITLNTLWRVAHALDRRLDIRFL